MCLSSIVRRRNEYEQQGSAALASHGLTYGAVGDLSASQLCTWHESDDHHPILHLSHQWVGFSKPSENEVEVSG